MQVPSNILLNWSGKPSWYIGFWVIAWGLVSACTSQVKSYGDIVACRFILGFVEAPFFCGVIFYLSKWYTKEEISFRMAIFYSASLLSGAFGNLIAAGILSGLNGAQGMAAWQVRAMKSILRPSSQLTDHYSGSTSSRALSPLLLGSVLSSSCLTFRIPGNDLRRKKSLLLIVAWRLTARKPTSTRRVVCHRCVA